MFYTIRHVTRFRYSHPVSETVMEVRMQPRSEGVQRCVSFELTTSPRARLSTYLDYQGNTVQYFDIPHLHRQQEIITQALVELTGDPAPTQPALDLDAWNRLDDAASHGAHWDYLNPSHFVQFTPLLEQFARELNAERRTDPLTLLREMNTAIYNTFDYVQSSTQVDSPIDEALEHRHGVCQDYAHILLALARRLGIPARYVSGYLFHRTDIADRSATDATHAWVETWLPELGWVGFDPTNNLLAGDRHIRVAVGRDYFDVPPTRGVFKGEASTELEVAVQVLPAEKPLAEDTPSALPGWEAVEDLAQMMAQQQQ